MGYIGQAPTKLPLTSSDITDGTIALADMASQSVDEDNLYISNSGSNGQFLSKQSGDTGGLTWAAAGLPYAIIVDQKAYDVAGGTFTSGAWQIRNLNTEIVDANSIVSIASNKFTLGAGTYEFFWKCQAFLTDRHSTLLWNDSDGSVVKYGTSEYADSTINISTSSFGLAAVTIAASKDFEIHHRCQTTRASDGFGNTQNTDSGAVSNFTLVKITKHA